MAKKNLGKMGTTMKNIEKPMVEIWKTTTLKKNEIQVGGKAWNCSSDSSTS